MNIKRTEEFNLAYRFVTETNENIFLTGKAGTGKTTFLKFLRDNSVKNIVVAAPTGVAAINARGVTLHSLFQLPFGIILPYDLSLSGGESIRKHPLLSQIHYSREKLFMLKNLELLVIDEVSMVTCYIIDAIDLILRNIKKNYQVPFGGVQILFIGDLHQLPPVIKNDDWEILQEYYNTIFFFDGLVLRGNQPVLIELKEIFRQKDDTFIDILNGIRNNNISDEDFLLLNSRLNREFDPDEQEGYITLTTHNYQSDAINKVKLNNLSSNPYTFIAEVKGEFPENNYPAEKELTLKCGSQVMFLKNDTEGKQYFNGKLGIVTELNSHKIKVQCKDDPFEIEVNKTEWHNIRYKADPDTREIKEEILGTFIQYPLRLAWANTIHKSQGLTFDKVIIDSEKAFAMGQVYVALSRCTSLEGLVLRSPVYKNYLGAHKDLKKWQYAYGEPDLAEKFNSSRERYILQNLLDIFTWNKWYHAIRDLQEFLSDNIRVSEIAEKEIKIPSESLQWVQELLQKQKALSEVADKFRQLISKLFRENSVIEENHILQKRLKDGASYFSGELLQWQNEFYNHPLSADTKKLSRKIDSYLEDINSISGEIIYKINYCRNGFLLDDYLLKLKAFTPNRLKQIRSSYSNLKAAAIIPEETPHPELCLKLIELRKEISKSSPFSETTILSNKAIVNICTSLPINNEELSRIKGFRKVKTARYAEKIISVVKEYYENNSKAKTDHDNLSNLGTVEQTIYMLRQGKTVEEIASERKFVIGTIETHLVQALNKDLITIDEVLDAEEIEQMLDYIPLDLDNVQLSAIKEKCPPEFTYGKLKLIIAWMQKKR